MSTANQKTLHAFPLSTGHVILRSLILSIACVISFWLMTHILPALYSVSREDDLLGGMWAVVATIFVCRYSQEATMSAALSRISATFVSFALCFVYLVVFPFDVWGMALLIAAGAIVVAISGAPDDIITTSITTAVVMVVAALGPHEAWRQPILRLVDTVVGVVVGVAAAWVCELGIARLARS